MTHYESGSLRVRKGGQLLFHLCPKLDARRQACWRWRVISAAIQWIVFHPVLVFRSRRFPPRFFLLPLPHAVNCIVGRDSIHPRPEIRSRRKLAQLLIPAQECLLNNLFGIVPVPGHPLSQPENSVAEPRNQNATAIATARDGPLPGNAV